MNNFGWRRIMPALLWLTWLATVQARQNLSIGQTAEIKEEGIKFKIISGAKPQALPSPQTYIYKNDTGENFEWYAPRDLWLAGQFLGRWADEDKRVLTLAAVRYPLPGGFKYPHCSREEFDKALAAAGGTPTGEALAKWVSDLAQGEAQGMGRTIPNSLRLQNIQAYEIGGGSALAYVFTTKPSAPAEPGKTCCALFQLAAKDQVTNAMKTIEREFLPAVEITTRPGAGALGRPRDSRAAAAPTNATAEFAQSRQEALNSIRGLKDWWYADTRRFLFVTDLPGAKKPFVQRLQGDLELLRSAYEALIPPRQPITAVSAVRIFARGADYESYMPADMKWSGGAWVALKRELVIRSYEGVTGPALKHAVARSVYHESFHQYLYYALGKDNPAVWFNEGHATVFEGADLGPNGLVIGEVDDYREQVEKMIKENRVDLQSLFDASYQSFYQKGGGAGDDKRGENYALAWALIYYLRKQAPFERTPVFGSMLDRYVEAFWTSWDAAKATGAALEGVNVGDLQTAFCAFWGSPAQRQAARRNSMFKKPAAGPAANR